MIRLHQADTFLATGSEEHSISQRLLRTILVERKHQIGERILVVGESLDRLAEQLFSLGYDVEMQRGRVVGTETAAAVIPSSKSPGNEQGGFGVQHGSRQGGREIESLAEETSLGSQQIDLEVDFSEGHRLFDLILVVDDESYRGSLLEQSSRRSTSLLLSQVKPLGDFVFVRQRNSKSIHDSACWNRHLACFPGLFESMELPLSWFARLANWEMRGRKGDSSTKEMMVVLRVPVEHLSAAEWQRHAQSSLFTGGVSCCSEAVQDRRTLRIA